MSAPDFETLIDFTPPSEGVYSIEWKGKLKRRGLNSVSGCDAAGKVIVSAKPGASEIAAKWNDYFAKAKPEASECVKIGLDTNQIIYESTDPSAKLVSPTDPIVKPVFEKCDSFLRAKQPQQNFACTITGGIKTFCDNQYAERGADGRLKAISRADAIKLHLNGREWTLGNTETTDAKVNRLKSEDDSKKQQLADATKNNASLPNQTPKTTPTVASSSQDKLDRAYSIGVCMGAISIAKQRLGDNTTFFKYYNKFKSTILNYEEIIGQPCLSNMTKTCFEKLPDEAKLYFNGLAGSRKELSSPSPVTILNNNRIGTDRSTLITAIAGYCEQ